MRSRAFRPIATILSLLLMAAVPVHAGPLTFADVVHAMANMQNGGQNPELRLRTIQQQGSTPTTAGTQTPARSSNGAPQSGSANGTATSGSNGTAAAPGQPVPLVSDTQTPTSQQQGPAIQVTQGDTQGTVCDCGEVRTRPGFPLWWLAGIPAICLTGICTHGHTNHQCIPGPGEDSNCEKTTTTIPEPASLLLLGSGLAALGAGARRRYHRVKLNQQEAVATEV